MNWTLNDLWPLTYREYVFIYDSFLLSSWDHTALLASQIQQLTCTVANTNPNVKSKMKPRTMFDMHPYRESSNKFSGMRKITAKNFHVLREIGNALARGK